MFPISSESSIGQGGCIIGFISWLAALLCVFTNVVYASSLFLVSTDMKLE